MSGGQGRKLNEATGRSGWGTGMLISNGDVKLSITTRPPLFICFSRAIINQHPTYHPHLFHLNRLFNSTNHFTNDRRIERTEIPQGLSYLVAASARVAATGGSGGLDGEGGGCVVAGLLSRHLLLEILFLSLSLGGILNDEGGTRGDAEILKISLVIGQLDKTRSSRLLQMELAELALDVEKSLHLELDLLQSGGRKELTTDNLGTDSLLGVDGDSDDSLGDLLTRRGSVKSTL